MASFLTPADEQNYGRDLLDVSQRAALSAVAPKINQLERQLAAERRRRLDDQIARAVPNYQEIDRDPRWHRWLLGIDLLSGQVRQTLMNSAIQRGDERSVAALFKSFQQQEAGATQPPTTRAASSNRMRYDKPVYSRDQIKLLYRQHEQGAYAGREQEWSQLESDIIAAGREGRILGAVDLHGK